MPISFAVLANAPFAGGGFSGMDDGAAGRLEIGRSRPLLALTYAFNRRLGGWEWTNIALAATAAAVLAAILAKLGAGRAQAALAACLFASHPMAVDAVQSVAGRSSLLCSLFILLSISAFVSNQTRTALELGLLALFAKGEAAALLLLLPATLWITHRARRAAGAACLSAALLAAALPFSLPLVKAAGAAQGLIELGLKSAPPLAEHLRNYPSALGYYIAPNLFIPGFGLSADPAIRYSKFFEVLGWLLAALCLAGVLHPTALDRRARLAAALILSSWLIYLPAPLPDVFFEHRAYLAVAGASILIASAFRRMPFAGFAFAALLAIMTWNRAQIYSSPESLWADAAAKGGGLRAVFNNAQMAARRGDYALAERQMETLPKLPFVKRQLVGLALARKDFAKASRLLDAEEGR